MGTFPFIILVFTALDCKAAAADLAPTCFVFLNTSGILLARPVNSPSHKVIKCIKIAELSFNGDLCRLCTEFLRATKNFVGP